MSVRLPTKCVFFAKTMYEIGLKMGFDMSGVSVNFYIDILINPYLANSLRKYSDYSKIEMNCSKTSINGEVVFYKGNKRIVVNTHNYFIIVFLECITNPTKYLKRDFVLKSNMNCKYQHHPRMYFAKVAPVLRSSFLKCVKEESVDDEMANHISMKCIEYVLS